MKLQNVTAKEGEYFCNEQHRYFGRGLTLYGDYSFDGARNVEIRNSRLLSKDAFWNSENVTASFFYFRRVPRLERQKSYACGLYGRESAGNVLH